MHRLASLLGFDDPDDAEETIAAQPSLWNTATIEKSHRLADGLREELGKQLEMIESAQAVYKGALAEIREAKEDNIRLRHEREDAKRIAETKERTIVELQSCHKTRKDTATGGLRPACDRMCLR